MLGAWKQPTWACDRCSATLYKDDLAVSKVRHGFACPECGSSDLRYIGTFNGTHSVQFKVSNNSEMIACFKSSDDISLWMRDVLALLEKTDSPEAKDLLARVKA